MLARAAVVLSFLLSAVTPSAAQDITAHFSNRNATATATVDHGDWGRLLAAHVRADADGINRVDYRRFKAQGQGALRGYLARMQAVPVTSLSRDEQFAYWVNLYNAATIEVVLTRYPVASIRDIKPSIFSIGPWGMKVVRVEGIELSLDDIEHKILRPIWRDPRIHYAVNCASIGCPNLQREPYTAARLNAMLEAAAREYINHPRGISAGGGAVQASRIFSWYAEDFGGNAAGVLRHARHYAREDLARALARASTIDGYDYDWRLNDTVASPR